MAGIISRSVSRSNYSISPPEGLMTVSAKGSFVSPGINQPPMSFVISLDDFPTPTKMSRISSVEISARLTSSAIDNPATTYIYAPAWLTMVDTGEVIYFGTDEDVTTTSSPIDLQLNQGVNVNTNLRYVTFSFNSPDPTDGYFGFNLQLNNYQINPYKFLTKSQFNAL